MTYHILTLSKADYPELIQLWETSVRATHHFLEEEDILLFKNLIPEKYLDAVHLYAVRDSDNKILGFLGVSDDNIDMLFIHPDVRGKGIGSFLLNYAVDELCLRKVDVNEQNEQAVGFYLHKGFSVVGRSERDGAGKPYPILHLEISTVEIMIKNIYAVWIYVSDLEKSVDFYQNKIGLKIKFQNEDWIEFDLGKTSFAILKRPVEKGAVVAQKTRIMFETDGIEIFYKEALVKGIKLIGGIREESYGKLLTFEDPDGHWLEVFENKVSGLFGKTLKNTPNTQN